jgi:DNA mismatch repair protein MutH
MIGQARHVQSQRRAVRRRPQAAQRGGVRKVRSRLLAPARTMSQPATAAAITGIVCELVRWIMPVMVPPRLRGGIGWIADLLQKECGAPTGGRHAA